MTELPKGWTSTTLGAVGNYWNGRAFKKSEWRPPGEGRQIIRIQDLTGSHQKPNYFDGDVDERNVARKGDVLISWAATLGVFEWPGPEAVINQHIFKLESFINQRFHRYLLRRCFMTCAAVHTEPAWYMSHGASLMKRRYIFLHLRNRRGLSR
jgi:type I restriction enzyme S subunit